MIATLAICAVTLALIVTERIDRAVAAMLGGTLVVVLGLVPYEEAVARIDLNVVFLLIGMMIMVAILAETGLFEWVAVSIARGARGNGLLLVVGLLFATATLSAVLDNVTTVVLIAPITILVAQILDLPVAPLLVLEAVFSNIGGTATLVGDPPNILIGSQAGLGFNDFLLHIAPVAILIGAAMAVMTTLRMRNALSTTAAARERILRADPARAILEPVLLRRGLAVFGLVMLAFVVSHPLGVEPGIVAIGGAMVMTLVCKRNITEGLEKVEWNTILFLIGLFMLVGAVEHSGAFEALGHALMDATDGSPLATTLAVLWLGGLLAALAGSLPVTMALLPLVQSIADQSVFAPGQDATPLFWALALGACLGGNGTLYAAAANVVVAQIGHRNGYPISFWSFLRVGLPVTLASLAISTVYLWLRYFPG
jgi:Na+/H+ antiporter NhaD/arsenite permease-like protein